MLTKLTNVLKNTSSKIASGTKLIFTQHFQERVIQRFEDSELSNLENVIKKAFEKSKPGEKIKYTHPFYGYTVVGKKIGLNGFECITCFKGTEETIC